MAAAVSAGCVARSNRVPVRPAIGILYSHFHAPLQHNFEATTLGTKHGSSTSRYLNLSFLIPFEVAWDSAAISDAARAGGIDTITHVDYELTNVLGIFSAFTVHVYGN
jgi:hypothetical protein